MAACACACMRELDYPVITQNAQPDLS
eukprot:SAG31_NODE_44059_length_264_cov_0.933333_1_plen_26_part_01